MRRLALGREAAGGRGGVLMPRTDGKPPREVEMFALALLADRDRWIALAERFDAFVPDHDHADLGEFVPDDCVFCENRKLLGEAHDGE